MTMGGREGEDSVVAGWEDGQLPVWKRRKNHSGDGRPFPKRWPGYGRKSLRRGRWFTVIGTGVGVGLVIFGIIFFLLTPPNWRQMTRKISFWRPIAYQAPVQVISSLKLPPSTIHTEPSLENLSLESRTVYLILAHDEKTVAGVEDMLAAMWFEDRVFNRQNHTAWQGEANQNARPTGDLFLIHIDASSPDKVFAPLQKWTTLTRHRVLILPQKFRRASAWGGFGLVDAQLALIQAAIYYAPTHFTKTTNEEAGLHSTATAFDYAILLDGSSFPLISRAQRQTILKRLPLHTNVLNMEPFSPHFISRVPWLGPEIDCLLDPTGPDSSPQDPSKCLYFSGTPYNGVIVKHDQWAILSSPTVNWLNDAIDGLRHGPLSKPPTRSTRDLRRLGGGHPDSVNYLRQWLGFFKRTKIWASDEAVLGTLIYNTAPVGDASEPEDLRLGGPSRLGPTSLINSPSIIFTKWGHTCQTYTNQRVPYSPCYLGLGDLPELLNETGSGGGGREWRDDLWLDDAETPVAHILRSVNPKWIKPDPTLVERRTEDFVVHLPMTGAVAMFARKFKPADPIKSVLVERYGMQPRSGQVQVQALVQINT